MGTRLTGLSTFYMFQNSLNARNQTIAQLSQELSSGKKINRPSDDPTGDLQVLGYTTDLSRMGQYQRNISRADQFLSSSETALNQVTTIVTQAKQLAIQGANGTLDQTSRNQIADQIQQLQQQLVQTANTQVNGEYLFSGFKTQTAPFSLDPAQPNASPVATYNGDPNQMSVDVGDGTPLTIQVNGATTFKGDGTANTVDLFQTLASLETALRSNNVNPTPSSPTSVNSMLTALNTGLSQVSSTLATVGAYSNRADSIKNGLDDQSTTISTLMSSTQDADVATVAVQFQQANLALQGAIKSAGAVMNLPSLMDFINGNG